MLKQKQYIPFGPKKTNMNSSAEYKIISKKRLRKNKKYHFRTTKNKRDVK